MIPNKQLYIFLFMLLILFLLFHALESLIGTNIIFRSYLDDILCIPIVLSIMLLIFRQFIKKNNNYSFPISFVIIAVVYLSIFFELILPVISSRYNRDLVDILVYSIGGIIFYLQTVKYEILSL